MAEETQDAVQVALAGAERAAQVEVEQAKARAVARVEAVRPLARVHADLVAARAAVVELERVYGRAFTAATRGGLWDEAGLGAAGFAAPERRPAGRPRGSRSRSRQRPEVQVAGTPVAPETIEAAQELVDGEQ